jgi:dTDP-4-dehydrorhamnose reductase
MRIIVTGKNGQLGSEISALSANYSEIDFLFTGSDELDITKKNVIRKFVNEFKPDLIINCAAYTAVDKAEDDKENAEAVNHLGPRNLAEVCEIEKIRLIHISTDYVFNGNTTRPYTELDYTDPINEYGLSKLKGEMAIYKTNAHSIIIRTSWVYSSFGNNFLKTIIRLGNERESINVVSDQYGSPTSAKDLAFVCLQIAISKDKWNSDKAIYHYSNEGVISWYDFAKEIIEVMGLTCKVIPITTDQYPTKAIRPKYSVMSKDKIKGLGIEVRNWSDSLKDYSFCLEDVL